MSSARIVALAVLGLAGAVPAQATWRGVPELSLRASHAMAYDPVRGRVVLFGGRISWTVNATSAGLEPLGDTWEWNGSHWEPRTPAVSPPARKHFVMAFDPIRQRILLFGGMDASGTLLSDTWEWDGRNWTRLFPKHSPPACTLPGMATDAVRRRIVLFGGTVVSGLFVSVRRCREASRLEHRRGQTTEERAGAMRGPARVATQRLPAVPGVPSWPVTARRCGWQGVWRGV